MLNRKLAAPPVPKMMVACDVLCWIVVDPATKKIVEARVHALPENITVPADATVWYENCFEGDDGSVSEELAALCRHIAQTEPPPKFTDAEHGIDR